MGNVTSDSPETLLVRIKKVKLTAKEELIADSIVKNINKVAFLNGAQLAKECGVSATLITRFVQKLGYNGFQDFKSDMEKLFRHSTTPYDRFQYFISGKKSKKQAFHSSIAQDVQNLVHMQKLLNQDQIEEVVTCIEQGKTIYIAAMLASEICAQLLSFYLTRLGKENTPFLGIGLSKQVEYSDIGPEDVFIAISTMGFLSEVIEAARYAKNCGAKTIAITDGTANPLAKSCDFALAAPVAGATFDFSHVAPIAMVNVIVNSLAARYPDKILEKLAKDRERWAKFYRQGFHQRP